MANSLLFKSLVAYQFTQPYLFDALVLEEKLQAQRFSGCGEQDISSYGWAPAQGKHSTALVHEADGCFLICAAHEEKIIPPAVIAELLEERIDEIEAREDRKVFSKERRQIRDEIFITLLPRAFSKKKYTLAYIDQKNGLLMVNASTFNQAELLSSHLRQSLGSLPVTNPNVKWPPAVPLTDWLGGQSASPWFELGDTCELREPGDEGGTIIVRNEDLTSEEIAQHLQSGKQVSNLAVTWKDQLSVKLCDDLRMTNLKFTDQFSEKLDEIESDNYEQYQDATFRIMAGTLSGFMKDHRTAFGWKAES